MGYWIYSSPVGDILIAWEEDKIIELRFIRTGETLPQGEQTPLSREVCRQLGEYFAGKRKLFDFPMEVCGTEFQRRVWRALMDIPYGETRSYKDIAAAAGSPKAFRAVGMSNNRNPIAIAIPCHRVIGADGALVGYGGGMDKKAALLELEQKYR